MFHDTTQLTFSLFIYSWNPLSRTHKVNEKLVRANEMSEFTEGNSMGAIKIHNGGNYGHAQVYNAYNFS